MSSRSSVDVLSPEGVEFQHVSAKLATLRLGNALAACGALCGLIAALVLIVQRALRLGPPLRGPGDLESSPSMTGVYEALASASAMLASRMDVWGRFEVAGSS